MSEGSILFDYQQAIAQAERLEAIAEHTDKNAGSLAEAMGQTVSGWQADSGALFRKKGGRLEDNMETSAERLRALATEVREIAKRIYEMEMANLALAQQRDYA